MKLLAVVLAILAALFVAPAFVHGYIYPTGGDDTAYHLLYFGKINSQAPIYLGQFLVGKLVNALPFDPVATFSVFNYVGFVAMMVTVGLTTALALNPTAGIVAATLVGFGNITAINQFWSGAIFNLINVGVFLPIMLFAWHKRGKWLVIGAVATMLFIVFHLSALYLLGLVPFVVIYELMRSRGRKLLHGWWREMWLNRFVACWIGLIMMLLVATALDLAHPNSSRLLADAVIMICVAAGCIFGALPFKAPKGPQLIVVAVTLLLSVTNVSLWWQDNSAIKPSDKQAIAYLNTLPRHTFSAGPEVAQLVYGLYLHKSFLDVGGDYLILRSEPQTCGSDPESEWFRNEGRLGLTTNGYTAIARFDGEVVVTVYERR